MEVLKMEKNMRKVQSIIIISLIMSLILGLNISGVNAKKMETVKYQPQKVKAFRVVNKKGEYSYFAEWKKPSKYKNWKVVALVNHNIKPSQYKNWFELKTNNTLAKKGKFQNIKMKPKTLKVKGKKYKEKTIDKKCKGAKKMILYFTNQKNKRTKITLVKIKNAELKRK